MQWWTAQRLKSANAETRRQAVEKLGREGSAESIAVISPFVSDNDAGVRRATVRALGQIGHKDGIPALLKAISDSAAEVREAAVMALRYIGDLPSIQNLVPMLQDPNAKVRYLVARTLGRFGWEPQTDREQLLRDAALCDYASVAQVGAEGLKVLANTLNDTATWSNRRAIVEAIGTLAEDKAVPHLLSALVDSEPSVRVAAIEGLSQIQDARALKGLIVCLEDPAFPVRAAAVTTLGVLGHKGALPTLIKMLNDPRWDVRRAVVEALARFDEPHLVSALTPLLKDHDHDVRETTCEALGRFKQRTAISALVVALTDSQGPVRHAAALALREIDPDWDTTPEAQKAVPELQEAMRDREYWVRNAARDALQRIADADKNGAAPTGPHAEKLNAAMDILVSVLKNSERDLRQAAVEALGRIGNRETVKLLTPRLQDGDPWVQQAAFESLTKLGWQPPSEDLIPFTVHAA